MGVRPFMPRPLCGCLVFVVDEIGVENSLHLSDGFEPGAAAVNAEVLVELRAVQTLNGLVGLRSAVPGALVFDGLELQEEPAGAAVPVAAEFAPIVAERSLDLGGGSVKGGRHVGWCVIDERPEALAEIGAGINALHLRL